MSLLINRARMEGMVVFDYVDRFPQAVAELAGYLKDGRIKSREDIVRGGVAAFPATLLKLFSRRELRQAGAAGRRRIADIGTQSAIDEADLRR